MTQRSRDDDPETTAQLVKKFAEIIGDIEVTPSNAASIAIALTTTLASFFINLQVRPDEFEAMAEDMKHNLLVTLRSMDNRRHFWTPASARPVLMK